MNFKTFLNNIHVIKLKDSQYSCMKIIDQASHFEYLLYILQKLKLIFYFTKKVLLEYFHNKQKLSV